MIRLTLVVHLILCVGLAVRAEIVTVPPGSSYTHYTPVDNATSWVFFVKTCRDAKFGLFSSQTESSLVFEIVFGAGDNTFSVIRNGINSYSSWLHLGAHVDCDKFVPLWVDWGGGEVAIGTGTRVRAGQLVTRVRDVNDVVSYVAVATYSNQEGKWLLKSTCAK